MFFDNDLDYPEGMNPELNKDIVSLFEGAGYELINTDNGNAWKHPETGHIVHIMQTVEQPYEPDDDIGLQTLKFFCLT